MRWLVMLGATLSGCSLLVHECTLILVADSVLVELEGDTTVPGDYLIEVTVDGEVVASCEQTVPLPEDFGGAFCEGSVESRIDATSHLQVAVFDAPDELTVLVMRDETVLVEEQVEPEYAKHRPNGRGCGVSKTATVSLFW